MAVIFTRPLQIFVCTSSTRLAVSHVACFAITIGFVLAHETNQNIYEHYYIQLFTKSNHPVHRICSTSLYPHLRCFPLSITAPNWVIHRSQFCDQCSSTQPFQQLLNYLNIEYLQVDLASPSLFSSLPLCFCR